MSVSDDRSIRIWKLLEGEYKSVSELYGHRSRVWAVQETKDMLVSVSEDATCKVWNPEVDSKPFETLKGHTGKNVRALATFSASSLINEGEKCDLIATGGEDGAIKIWDVDQMKMIKSISGLTNEDSNNGI